MIFYNKTAHKSSLWNVYVSCDPATLSRDVALLKERGYKLKNAMAADLFPRCSHVESVVTLTRG